MQFFFTRFLVVCVKFRRSKVWKPRPVLAVIYKYKLSIYNLCCHCLASICISDVMNMAVMCGKSVTYITGQPFSPALHS